MMKAWNDTSLRFRLTILYTGLLFVLFVLLGVAFYTDTRHFLFESTARRLRAQTKPSLERDLNTDSTTGGEVLPLESFAARLARDLTSRDTAALILNTQGTIIANGRRLPEEPVSPVPNLEQVRRALGGANEINYIITAPASSATSDLDGANDAPAMTEEHLLVMLIPLRRGLASDDIIGVAQLATPLAPIESLLWRQSRVLVFGGGLTLLLAAAATLILTGSTLKPLRRMIVTSRRIAAGDLRQRVNLPRRADEVGALAAAFDDMIEQLESAFESQRRFVADAAHELRTPLTGINGSIEILLRGAQHEPATRARLLEGVREETARLIRLSERLLDLSRLEAGEAVLCREPLDLAHFFHSFLPQARVLAAHRKLVYEPAAASCVIRADADALKQLFYNLIDNAARHTEPDSTVRLKWQVRHNNVVEIVIEDNGEGIQADCERIFDPFYRADAARARRRGGAGLGLTIARRIAEAHSGTLTAMNKPDDGACFIVCLPV
ncbi:MAG: HAMP domain-containing histidine kinase [Pyrinomonadaceae bacterium MAG19_C2-C3]|nr:HAMP domain-containing histidine kinase [Pyrinomonadaceae bacterium MAG19_C2-C3]